MGQNAQQLGMGNAYMLSPPVKPGWKSNYSYWNQFGSSVRTEIEWLDKQSVPSMHSGTVLIRSCVSEQLKK